VKAEKVSDGVYVVHSDSGSEYTVFYNPRLRRFVCTCPDYVYRLRPCKHIYFLAKTLRGGVHADT